MRRSAAPSQLLGNAAKKMKFIPPAKITADCVLKEQKTQASVTRAPEECNQKEDGPLSSRALARICGLNLDSADHLENCLLKGNGCKQANVELVHHKQTDGKLPEQHHKSGSLFMKPKLCHKSQAEPEVHEEEAKTITKYYSVVWCKASKKKHKKWEGDAVLITKGRSLVLKDMEGRDIGKGSGYKSKELESLDEGQTLMIGGKEIEVTGVITEEDFTSGRCFHSVTATPHASCPKVSQVTVKAFSNPVKDACRSHSASHIKKDVLNCQPLYDPTTSDAMVMPRPTLQHQWIFNKAGLPLVDVVIDPHVAVHLRPHQREGVVFLYECVMGMRANARFGAILADEMGLGKTLQCITLLWTLLRQGPYGGKPVIKRALVVTPGSLVKNWNKECKKWLGSERLKVYAVDQVHKAEEFLNSPLYPVLIISYEMLLRSLDHIQRVDFGLIICDEGHRLKNTSIKTASALLSLTCERRIILTGTPVQNDLQEFYAIIEFVNPGILGSSCTYRKIYEEPILRSRQPSSTMEEKELGEERAAELARLTGLFILRRTQMTISSYLPPKLEYIVFCRPTAVQLTLYRKLLASGVVRSCLLGRLENSPHLVCIGALKKLSNHPLLLFNAIKKKEAVQKNDEAMENTLYEGVADLFPEDFNPDQCAEKDSGKLQVLSQLLAAIHGRGPAERVVLVSHYTQTLDLLQRICKYYGYKCARLDGQTPVSQRQHIVDGFNSKYSSDFIFLLSSKAGGLGLNLVGASHLILFDIDWNPANDIQAMARVWRDGQKQTVHIYRLLTTGTIDEKIYQRQISKQGLSGAVVDITKKSEHISFSTEELQDLFTLHEDSSCATHDLLECHCNGAGDCNGISVPEKSTAQRSCQLGTKFEKADSQRHLSMSELMQWKHFSGTFPDFPNTFLQQARENISFIFSNSTNHLDVSVHQQNT
ncbi:DNA repair and recombination protein RAD54B [Protopterus annectens]|uniref:DNA repair and recombination protein RAD54B n=1 Tax=Protopterus annectens TaxID=7888 RepID=UPI001CFBB3F4|nr:DNA repair and recombination protein RAD54B [Protopterus annectens]XP_043922494.1 DNA repair and recombination protein RAD54B [Protopterus annectens]XP_043922495.1 DNA repair and recombination protein RAD54B [Protopterus annectens]XP_043922496.1 DNA repair and recombination protein RAD54B [Protopterus annectens]